MYLIAAGQLLLVAGLAVLAYLWLLSKYAPTHPAPLPEEKSTSPNREPLEVLYPGPTDESPSEVEVDIIAVHGLGSNVDWSWTFKDQTRHINWLKDDNMLPAVVPKSRIIVYNYDSKWHANAPKTRLPICGKDLAHSVHNFRDRKADRPIIFIGHSLGGNVIQQALLYANSNPKFKYLVERTVGLIFLGSPFNGSKMQWAAHFFANLTQLVGSHSGIIRYLGYGDRTLRDWLDTFCDLLQNILIPVVCFYEQEITDYGRKYGIPYVFRGMVVDEDSACIDCCKKLSLHTDHLKMNKYSGPRDRSFLLVSAEIEDMCGKWKSVIGRRKPSREPCWTIPFGRNRDFIGRESILAQLLERIPPDVDKDDCQRTAIEGLGGVGKTQIAIEAAFHVRDKYPVCSVFWVTAVDAASFEKDYSDICRQLQIDGINEDKADVKLLVKDALSRDDAGSWLMVVDNADDKELFFGNTNLSEYLPFSRKGSILFTTRNNKVVVGLDIPQRNVITVAKMSRPEAIELFQRNLEKSQMCDTESTESVLDFLVDLPLAIRQASSFMKANKITTTKYLHYCRSSNEDVIKLLREDFKDRSRYERTENPISATWLISFKHISRDNHLAAKYLKFICFLAEKAIPVSLLPQVDDELEAEKAIGTLKAYAFITEREDPTFFDIHRLVRLAMRDWLASEGAQEGCVTEVMQQLSQVFPSPEHKNKDIWMKYLPHIRIALEAQEYSTNKEFTLHLLFKAALSYHILGKYQEAELLYQQKLKLSEKVLGPEHPDTLSTMDNIARILGEQRKYKEAEQICQQILKLRKKVLGLEHPDTLVSMNIFAVTLSEQRKYQEAEQIYQQTLKLREKVLGPEHPDTLVSMNNVTKILCNQGKYKEAKQLYTLKLREKALGPEYPDTLICMNEFANTLYKQRDYKQIEQIYQQTLNLREELLGPEHLYTLSSMGSLARIFTEQKKYKEAEQICQQTLKLRKKVLGPEHPGTLSSIQTLAIIFTEQKKYKEAEKICQQILKLREKFLDLEYPATLSSMSNLVIIFNKQRKYKEAEQICQQILKLREKELGSEYPDILNSMSILMRIYTGQKKYQEAEQICQQILKLREKELGSEHSDTLNSLSILTRIYIGQRKYKEAERICQHILKLREKELGPEHSDTLDSMSDLVRIFTGQKKYQEAEQLCQQTLKLREKVLGPEHLDILSSISNLAEIFTGQKKYQEAEQICQHILKLREKELGPEHPDTLNSMSDLVRIFTEQKKYKEAEKICQEILKLREKELGPEHLDTLDSMSDLAEIFTGQKKYQEAEQLCQQILQLREKVLGSDYPDTLDSMSILTRIFTGQKKYQEAEQLCQQILKLREKVLGPEHPDTLLSMNSYANTLYKHGNYERAEQVYRQAFTLMKKVLGPAHPHTLTGKENLVDVLNKHGKHEEAKEIC